MKLKQLLEQLNQLAKERPEALEMEVSIFDEKREEAPLVSVIDVENDLAGYAVIISIH